MQRSTPMKRYLTPYLLTLSLLLGVPAKALAQGGGFTSIDVPGAQETIADGINDAGDIVGSTLRDGYNRGFLRRDGQFAFIDYPVSIYTAAFGINNSGDIVGYYFGPPGGFHAYL